jgi:acetyl esterase/lipase
MTQEEPVNHPTMTRVVLEPAAQKFADKAAQPPYLHDLGPSKGRTTVDALQSDKIKMSPSDIEEYKVPVPSGEISVRIVRPQNAPATLPVVLYIHGAGWVFGNGHTHNRLTRQLATGAEAAVVFPFFSRSPEAKYPTAIEQIYAVATWIADHGAEHGLDAERMAIAGDGTGGNMAAAVSLMAKTRAGPRFVQQVLFYPVTDANFDTGSYEQFATGYGLSRDNMKWYWDQYVTDSAQRAEITASPLRATKDQLADLPPALVITGDADVLRDEGEAYASKLRQAGVPVTAVRFEGMIHDFVMLNALADTQAAHGAMVLTDVILREAFSK